jgi:hypothetical protein
LRRQDATPETRNHTEIEAAVAGPLPVNERHRAPHLSRWKRSNEQRQFRTIGELKARRHDTNDCVWGAVQDDRPAEYMRIAAKLPLPQSVADNYYRLVARPILVSRERPAKLWLDPQQIKQLGRNAGTRNSLRLTAAR